MAWNKILVYRFEFDYWIIELTVIEFYAKSIREKAFCALLILSRCDGVIRLDIFCFRFGYYLLPCWILYVSYLHSTYDAALNRNRMELLIEFQISFKSSNVRCFVFCFKRNIVHYYMIGFVLLLLLCRFDIRVLY